MEGLVCLDWWCTPTLHWDCSFPPCSMLWAAGEEEEGGCVCGWYGVGDKCRKEETKRRSVSNRSHYSLLLHLWLLCLHFSSVYSLLSIENLFAFVPRCSNRMNITKNTDVSLCVCVSMLVCVWQWGQVHMRVIVHVRCCLRWLHHNTQLITRQECPH